VINTVSAQDRAVVEAYLASMQAGPKGLDNLVALFDADAVYIEPFEQRPVTHTGREEIRQFFAIALAHHLDGVRLTLDRLDLAGEQVRSEWTCEMPGMNATMRGYDLVTLRAGKIARLETTVTEFGGA
jgi:ketosteroid isomerase-like protein